MCVCVCVCVCVCACVCVCVHVCVCLCVCVCVCVHVGEASNNYSHEVRLYCLTNTVRITFALHNTTVQLKRNIALTVYSTL